MKTYILRNTYAAIAALFIALFALPQQARAQTEYDLWIAGTRVTSANCNNLSTINGVSGTVKYDPGSKTLTLDEATIKSEYSCIKHVIEGLTIKVEGKCELETNVESSDVYSAVEIKGNTTIKGKGTLELECMGNDFLIGIYIGSAKTLTIEDCTVKAYAHLWQEYSNEAPCGIRGGTGSRLKVKKATVRACGYSQNDMMDWGHAIKDIDALDMEDCYITNPAGAKFDASRKGVTFNGELLSDVTIATLYNLWIAGTRVTSANCNNLSTINGVSGTVKYDPGSKTLTLDEATIKSEYSCIKHVIEGLTIKVEGKCELETNVESSDVYSAVEIKGNTTIKGKGTLELECMGNDFLIGIYIGSAKTLTIEDCTVKAYAHLWQEYSNEAPCGIRGGTGSRLKVKKATVRACGYSQNDMMDWGHAIKDIDALDMEDCYITNPAGAKFDASRKGVTFNGELLSDVTIATHYDLEIAGKWVTPANCDNLGTIDGVSGTVKYDPLKKILTLQGATIDCNIANPIYSHIDGLTIKVIGTNKLITGRASLYFTQPLTITGGGVLNAKSERDCGIFANRTHLTIDNCTVNAEGGDYGIAGNDGSSEKLTIKNATVTAVGTKKGSICDLAELNLIGCSITEPTGATFDSSKHGVVLNGELVKSKVVIKKNSTGIEAPTADNKAKQGIYTIGGVKLNGEVRDLPKGIYIVNGKKVVKK